MGGIPTPEAARALMGSRWRWYDQPKEPEMQRVSDADDLRAYCYRTAERAADWLAGQMGAARKWSQLMDVEQAALAWDVATRIGIDRALMVEPVPAPRRQ